MLIERIKFYVTRGLSSIIALGVFVLMLPLTLGAVALTMCVGAVALIIVRHRIKKAGLSFNHIDKAGLQKESTFEKPPIEGSYTVIHK